MFCKVYKENQKKLEKCTTNIVGLEPNPLGSSFYDTTLGLFGVDGHVLLM